VRCCWYAAALGVARGAETRHPDLLRAFDASPYIKRMQAFSAALTTSSRCC
jgi:hypothetical protein